MGWENIIFVSLAAGENSLSEPFSLKQFKPNGFFSCQVVATGDGGLKIQYLVSNVESPTYADFVIPTGASNIVTAHTKTSGTAANGKDLYQFPAAGEPIFSKWIRLKFTEVSLVSSINATIYMNIQ